MKKHYLFASLFFDSCAMAGTSNGYVTSVLVTTDGGNGHGVAMFNIDGQRDNPPSCGSIHGGKSWAISLEHESGRGIYSLILSAHSQKRRVYVNGRGNCNSWGDREEPKYVEVYQ
ncbi:MAG: hypothetical protein ABW086_11430 [Sedimenticola sp.]